MAPRKDTYFNKSREDLLIKAAHTVWEASDSVDEIKEALWIESSSDVIEYLKTLSDEQLKDYIEHYED